MSLNHALRWTLGLVVSMLALLACSAAPGVDNTGTSASPIVGGTPVTNDSFGTLELLFCPSGATPICLYGQPGVSGCSGNMIADKWLLTAHHCVTQGELTTGGTPYTPSTLKVLNPASANVSNWATATQIFRHPTLDVALVELDQSVLDANGSVLTMPVWSGTSAGLDGQTIYCQGYGVNDVQNLSGFGTLRGATFTVSQGSPGSFVLDPNSAGDYLAPGDSGAPCFLHGPYTGRGHPFNALVGVMSSEYNPFGVNSPPAADNLVGADGFQSWVASTIGDAWQPLGGCSATAVTWDYAVCQNKVYGYNPGDQYPFPGVAEWMNVQGQASALTEDSQSNLWAVGAPPGPIFFGVVPARQFDPGITPSAGNVTWLPLSNMAFGGGPIAFRSVAAGTPEAAGANENNDDVWASDTSGNVWMWNGYVSYRENGGLSFGRTWSVNESSNPWFPMPAVPNGAVKVAMQTETEGGSTFCNIHIPWAMDTQGNVYQYSVTRSTASCTPTGFCPGGCWIPIASSAADISSNDYMLDKFGSIWLWNDSSGTFTRQRGPTLRRLHGLAGIGAGPAGLFAMDNAGLVYANW